MRVASPFATAGGAGFAADTPSPVNPTVQRESVQRVVIEHLVHAPSETTCCRFCHIVRNGSFYFSYS